MSILLSLIISSVIHFVFSVSAQEGYTPDLLLNYTLTKYPKDNKYFLCDPSNFVTDKQRYVISHRFKKIYDMFGLNVFFIVVDKISEKGLEDIVEEEEEDDENELNDDEIVGSINNTKSNNTNQEINSWKKNEKMKKFTNKIGKLLSKKHYGNETDSLIIVYSVNEVQMYAKAGKYAETMMVPGVLDNLFEGKDIYLQKKDLYHAVDDFLTDFIYYHKKKSVLESALTYLGTFSEIIVIGVIVLSYMLYSKGDNKEPSENNAPAAASKAKNVNKNDRKNK